MISILLEAKKTKRESDKMTQKEAEELSYTITKTALEAIVGIKAKKR